MRWVATAGVLMRMVLNLGILKIVLLIPTLSDQYNAGPLEVSFTINPVIRIGILKTHNKHQAITRSKKRLTKGRPEDGGRRRMENGERTC